MNILYIEDNRLNFRLVQKMLKGQHTVYGAMTGLEGIKEAKKIVPDLILLDINLPDLDGFKVHEAIREDSQLSHIPIIALTANSMYGDRERILDSGFDDYLAKPVTRIELTNTIVNNETKNTVAVAS